MALIFCDGFDSCAAFTDVVDRWDFGPATSGGFSLTGGRAGGPCLEQGTGNIAPPQKMLPTALCQPGGGAALFVGTSIRVPSYPTSGGFRAVLYLLNERATPAASDTANRVLALTTLGVQLGSDGRLSLYRQGVVTAVATGTTVLSLATWYRLEVKIANIDDTGGIFELRINGVVEFSVTDADLYQAGPKEIVAVQIQNNACRHDDVLIWDSTGAAPNNFMGDLLIETLRPNGAGTTTQSTPNTGTAWQAVDEVALDFDTTYTAISTVNNLDTYAYGNMATTPAVIHGVVVSAQANSPGMTPRKIKQIAKQGETSIQGPEHSVLLDLTAAYKLEQDFFPTKPGGGAWTKTDVDAAEFGWQVTQ